MQFIVKFVAAIVPYLLRFMDRHSDEYLEMLNKRIVAFIGGNEFAVVRLVVIDKEGNQVENCMAGFNIKDFGRVYKKSDGNVITITGLKEGIHEIEVQGNIVKIEIEDTNSIIEKMVVIANGNK